MTLSRRNSSCNLILSSMSANLRRAPLGTPSITLGTRQNASRREKALQPPTIAIRNDSRLRTNDQAHCGLKLLSISSNVGRSLAKSESGAMKTRYIRLPSFRFMAISQSRSRTLPPC